MAIKKQFLKSKPVCKVTFTLDKNMVSGAKQVSVAGQFNDWNTKDTLMKKSKAGVWKAILDLPTGSEYQFKYCIDGEQWINDDAADKYISSGIGGEENSVIVC